MWYDSCDISELIGKTPIEINNSHDELVLKMSDGSVYKFYHYQDCCENVSIDDIAGDLDDLLNSPITVAEERTSRGNGKDEYTESCMWTFYELGGARGYATIRWYGSSNGYYSESVTLSRIAEPTNSAPSF